MHRRLQGNQNGDLLDVINEYSNQYSQAGLSAEDMFNSIKNGAETGVWSIDKMGDAFKEFSIRMNWLANSRQAGKAQRRPWAR